MSTPAADDESTPEVERDPRPYGLRRASDLDVLVLRPDDPPPGWYETEPVLCDPATLQPWLEMVRANHHKRPPVHIIASYIFQGLVKHLALPSVMATINSKVTLDVRTSNCLVHVTPSRVTEVALIGDAVLDRDQDAQDPGGVGCEPLLESVRALTDAFAAATRLSRRTLWGNAVTALTVPFTRLYEAAEDQGADTTPIVQAVHELLGHPDCSPLDKLGEIVVVGSHGKSTLRLARRTCCLAYKDGDHDYCDSCPVRPMDERLQDWAQTAAERISV